MELPLQLKHIVGETVHSVGFNPCFNGTTSATPITLYRSQDYVDVSILVLMELPLQPA